VQLGRRLRRVACLLPFRAAIAAYDVQTQARRLEIAMAEKRRRSRRSGSRRDSAQLPAEVLDKLRVEFYSEPSQAAFKALAE
jgi:predicted ATP-dependent Lon-type protease